MTMKKEDTKPSTVKIWFEASRPHTLTASIAPVLAGSSVTILWHTTNTTSLQEEKPTTTTVGAVLLFAIFAGFIQIGTNLHNDYADFIKGADTDKRVGQARATQKGWLTPFQTASAATICLMCASVIGGTLTKLCEHSARNYDGYMRFVSVTSVLNAVAYTGGPYPLGYIGLGNVSIAYSGLGEVFSFLYFGLVATFTVPYLYVRIQLQDPRSLTELIVGESLFRTTLLIAVPIGFMATAIIVVNNLRDRFTDMETGKRTVAVRFGETFTRIEYMLLLLGSYGTLIPLNATNNLGGMVTTRKWLYLPLASLPLAYQQLKAVGLGRNNKEGAALNDHVGGTARLQLLYCVLQVTGIWLAS